MTPLIHWDFSGKSNADANTIVEDLTGNGYDLELKNFAFDNVSGYNGYPTDFRKWYAREAITGDDFEITSKENILTAKGTFTSTGNLGLTIAANTVSVNQIVVKVTGLKENQYIRFSNESGETILYQILKNGISIINTTNYGVHPGWSLGLYFNSGDITQSTNVDATIEIFPLYPDQLVFNGIDNFCQCTKDFILPISRGYSWIAKYKILDTKVFLVGKGKGAANNVISVLRETSTNFSIYSYGTNSVVSPELIYNNEISYGTSRFAGKQNITKGTIDDNINNKFVLGTLRPNEPYRFFNGTMSEFYLFDRDLTQSQIEKFISDNMIPLPEVYYDVAKQGTLNEHTTKDKLIDFSGNQHHGTLHNFTFDESNGWGYYPLNTVPCDKRVSGNTVVINGNSTGVIIYNQRLNVNAENFTQDVVIPEFRVKVTGLSAIKETQPNARIGFVNIFINDGGTNTSYYYSIVGSTKNSIYEDGIYTVSSFTVQFSNKQDITSLVRLCDLYWLDIINDGSVNITVEFLPTDEDCLRFNNTSQTYVDIDTLTKGFKTIFMVFNPAAMGQVPYDQRNPEALNAGRNKFAIFGENNIIAWNARNTGGVTYINGELNTTKLSSSLIGQKHCAILVNDTIEDGDTTTPNIGRRINQGIYYADMKFYKFLGFKEALSEKQIKMVIEKYGLQIN